MSKLLLVFIGLFFGSLTFATKIHAANTTPWWEFQAVDTMKYSRDLAAAKVNDPNFDTVIDTQVKNIASIGATHVSIATPYDEQFFPYLERWVRAARKYKLKVWFRGNFAGWEGWFDYKPINRETHIKLTREFISKHAQIFENGDLFSACPECENGKMGDPRRMGDVKEYRQFLIDEYSVTRLEFSRIGKNVQSNIVSMNADVARLIMDPETTRQLGGIITIDHYVASTDQLAKDIKDIAAASRGKVILGEFGAPIPDIHGSLSEIEQARWIDDALSKLYNVPELVGINYWVGVGGSTKIWNEDNTERKVAETIRKYFFPRVIYGKVIDQDGNPIYTARVSSENKTAFTAPDGTFVLPYLGPLPLLHIEAKNSKDVDTIVTTDNVSNLLIQLETKDQGILVFLKKILVSFFQKFF